MPERDPMDEAYLRAEQALDDTAAREARRARVLAAVAQDPATPAAPTAAVRRPIRRYGGWLAAACVAGLSVWTAGQVYRLSPRKQGASPAVQSPAPPAAKALAPPPAAQVLSAPPPVAARARPRPVMRSAPIAPTADIAPPPPLPIPPVEKPIQAPRPLSLPPTPQPALAQTPAAPPLAAPVVVSKSASALAEPSKGVAEAVVVSGSRVARRDYAASAPTMEDVSQTRMRAEAARLRAGVARLHYDAIAGRTDDIEATLAQGVPVDAVDQDGETALMISIKAGQREAAAVLRRHGASLDLKNLAGVNARDMAAAKRDPDLDRALDLTPRRITPSAATPP
jgi:hypothetical protein